MYFDSRNANLAMEMTLGGKTLNFATSYKYLGHVICNDLSDEADIQASSTAIKNKLFTAYFSNIYMCKL